MNSRERVMTALRNEKPDRVPFVDFVDEELQLKITGGKKMNTAEFAKHLGMDGIFMPGYYGDYCAPVFSTGTGPHVGEGIIKSREDLAKVVFPDADDPSFYDKANRFIEDFGKEDLAIFFGLRPGTYATIFSIGMIDFSYAIYDDIEFVKELHGKYIDWNIKVVENLQKIDRIDFFALYDDMAFNSGPMVSPDMFRKVFVPGYKRLAEAIKIPWAFHSDGNLMPLMDDLVDLGMACINPIEPGPMSIAEVNEKYGERVCLWGNIDLHYTLTRGTPEEVDAEVKQRIKDAGKKGGYILSSANSCTHYCKPENVIAMANAVKKYGKYPIDLD